MTESNDSKLVKKCNHQIGARIAASEAGHQTYISDEPCKRGHTSPRRTVSGACIECETEKYQRIRTPEMLARAAVTAADRAAKAAAQAAGQRTYQPAEPCSKGHVAPRSVLQGHCVECNRLRNAKRRAENPEWVAESRRRDYEARREAVKAKVKAWRDANPQAHRDRVKAWKKANPEAKNAHNRTRRAREYGCEGRHTEADIRRIYAEQNGLCKVCDIDLAITGPHVDHVIPLAAGGSNGAENIQLLCPTCNMRKGAKPFDLFLAEYMFGGF